MIPHNLSDALAEHITGAFLRDAPSTGEALAALEKALVLCAALWPGTLPVCVRAWPHPTDHVVRVFGGRGDDWEIVGRGRCIGSAWLDAVKNLRTRAVGRTGPGRRRDGANARLIAALAATRAP